MDLHFEPINPANRSQAEALTLLPSQKGYVESVRECLSEADKRSCWRPVGIYDGDTMVGFAMYGFFWEYLPFGRVWLDRILIDCNYQGMSYGTSAVMLLLEKLSKEYRRKKIYLSVYDDNHKAIQMYQKLGFRFNGQKDVHGEKVMVYRSH